MTAMRLPDSDEVRIVPASDAALRAEEDGGEALARTLGADAPVEWPPEFGGPSYARALLARMAQYGDPGPFGGWYIIAGGRLVGFCGFKGPPDAGGSVEIGYSVAPPYQRRGYASAAVRLLLAQAFSDPRVRCVVAQTLSDRRASIRVLEVCGFEEVKAEVDDGVVLTFVVAGAGTRT